MRTVSLENVAKLIRGITFSSEDKKIASLPSYVACLRTTNVQTRVDWHDLIYIPEKYVQDKDKWLKLGDILISIANSKELVGKVARVDKIPLLSTFGGFISVIRPNPQKVSSRYLFYYLSSPSTQSQLRSLSNQTTNIANLSAPAIQSIFVPLPSDLDEQKRIATILENADRLRRLRRYALELSGTYLQAVFLDMFYKNADKNWPNESIELLAKSKKNAIRTGPFGSQLLHSEFVKEGIAVLGIDNAVQNRFEWGVRRFITEEKYKQLQRYTVFPDDVIITIMGTPGRCAIIPSNFPLAINTKHLCCITLDQAKCLPTYLKSCFLMHPTVLRQLNISERGAVMPGLNMEIIKELIIPLPPLSLQEKFSKIAQQFERIQTQQREAERQAEHLFQTLLHKAFQGELTVDEGDGVVLDVEANYQPTAELRRVAEVVGGDAYQLALPME